MILDLHEIDLISPALGTERPQRIGRHLEIEHQEGLYINFVE